MRKFLFAVFCTVFLLCGYLMTDVAHARVRGTYQRDVKIDRSQMRQRAVRERYRRRQLPQYQRTRALQQQKGGVRFERKKTETKLKTVHEDQRVCGRFKKATKELETIVFKVVPDNIDNTAIRNKLQKAFKEFITNHCKTFPEDA
jgi:preprotein translocase subunit SecF